MSGISTINNFPTFSYAQPEEYHFSHDSVFLARFVFERLREMNLQSISALDLCAGCGIVGLDFLYHCKQANIKAPIRFDFIELQNVYKPFFETNCERLNFKASEIRFLNQSFTQLLAPELKNTYNLILCNPPYFEPGLGRMSPSVFKNRCRFFIDGTFEELIRGIDSCLLPHGEAFVLIRPLIQHNVDLLARARSALSSSSRLSLAGDIRGTHLAHIQKTR